VLPASLQDDVPEEVKQQRLAELIAVYRQQLHRRSAVEVGRRHLVLVEGPSRRSGGSCQRLAAIWGGDSLWAVRWEAIVRPV
jgi:tRNA A37 methylthiotransferase MiaB